MGKLFDYTKDDKGVLKNEKQKRPFFQFFDYYLSNIWRFFWLNVLFTIMSLPLVTNGLANVGMSYISRTVARNKHSFGFSDFSESIKKNWKQGLIVGIINTIIYLLIGMGIIAYLQVANAIIRIVCLSLTFTAFILITIMNFYIPTMINTFDYTLGQLYKNAFRFAFISFWKNLLCLIILGLVFVALIAILYVAGGYFYLALAIEILVVIFFYPFFAHLLIQFLTFPSLIKYIIEPYYRQHPDADIQLRLELGLQIESDDEDEEDFEDDDGIIFAD